MIEAKVPFGVLYASHPAALVSCKAQRAAVSAAGAALLFFWLVPVAALRAALALGVGCCWLLASWSRTSYVRSCALLAQKALKIQYQTSDTRAG